ncbi:hypothetical protein Tco_1578361 [Tanacetum coccineum]
MEGESTRAFTTSYTDDTLQILGLHKDQHISSFVHSLRTKSLVKQLSTDLPSTYKGLMEKTYAWIEAREVATNGAPNDRRENLRSKKSPWDNNRGQKSRDRAAFPPCERNKERKSTILQKSSRREEKQRRYANRSTHTHDKEKGVLYKGQCIERLHILRQGNHVSFSNKRQLFLGTGHNKSYDLWKRDSEVPLIGFSREKAWSSGEIPLEIMIGEAPLSRGETLNFAFVRSDSPYNMLLGRTAMQKMGIAVSTIHGAIKFHTAKGIRTVFSTQESDKIK